MGIKVRHNGQWVEMGFAGAPGGEPVGTIIAWGGSAANIPSNFRLCDGQSLSRTTYSDLFSKLGTIHGSGDGSTTFNIPDLRNQFIVGAKNGGNNTYPSLDVGATGGSADAVVVQHNHGITEPNNGQGHRHGYTAATSIGGYTDNGGSPDERSTTKNNLNTNYSTTGITINNEGVSGTNANLPPYYALCYIIKHTATSGSGGSSLVKLGTVDATSSTAAAFTNIPSTAKKITVSIHRANFNGTSNIGFLSMEVGDSSGYIQSGYESSYELRDQTSDAARSQNYYGLAYHVNDTYNYSYNIELVNITGNKWTISHVGHSNQGSGEISHGAGSIQLTNALDKLRIQTYSGGAAKTFDSGEVTVYYEAEGSGSSSGGSGGSSFVTGMIMMFSGTTAPTGWVLCDNSTEAQAANAPDLRDKFIVATGSSYNLNDTGGSANAVLIAHNHGAGSYSTNPNGSHTHSVGSSGDLFQTQNSSDVNNVPNEHGSDDSDQGDFDEGSAANTNSNGSHSHTMSGSSATVGKDNTGADSTSQTGTNANLPPYYALAFIMKT